MTGEQPPQPRLEEQILKRLELEEYLNAPTKKGVGQPAFGYNFLDAYENSVTRKATEAKIDVFLDMNENDPDYEDTKKYFSYVVEALLKPKS